MLYHSVPVSSGTNENPSAQGEEEGEKMLSCKSRAKNGNDLGQVVIDPNSMDLGSATIDSVRKTSEPDIKL